MTISLEYSLIDDFYHLYDGNGMENDNSHTQLNGNILSFRTFFTSMTSLSAARLAASPAYQGLQGKLPGVQL